MSTPSKSLVAATAKAQSADDGIKWWRAFRRWVADLDELEQYYDDLSEERRGQGNPSRTPADLENDAEWCQELTAKCWAGFERFDPADNCEQDDDLEDVLKTAPIAARLGVMIGSFMNSTPQSPELFMRAMVEQVADINGLTVPALETACREIVRTEKWPDIPKVVAVVTDHVHEWGNRRFALIWAERTRLALIPILIEREQKKKKEEQERAFNAALSEAKSAMATTQRIAKEIEAAKTAAKKAADEADAKIAKLMQVHYVAEQRESECLRKLRNLNTTEEEKEAQAAAKANGFGCGKLQLTYDPSVKEETRP